MPQHSLTLCALWCAAYGLAEPLATSSSSGGDPASPLSQASSAPGSSPVSPCSLPPGTAAVAALGGCTPGPLAVEGSAAGVAPSTPEREATWEGGSGGGGSPVSAGTAAGVSAGPLRAAGEGEAQQQQQHLLLHQVRRLSLGAGR